MSPAAGCAVVLAVCFAAIGTAKVAKAPALVARAEHAGFSARGYQLIGTAELAGALGVVAGLWFPLLGYAAGLGLLALMGGALLTHLRLGDRATDLAPAAVFAAAAAAYLVLLAATR